ncbi:hypothetical protein [Psychroflexus montanilacus]|uniref:hypothetical protein n=1 Tax=Psychroflexus montanilacus TaxID=2873598 RepID=UPI001CCD2C6F|nr:hypothetical protein [Psychroflexus montanilacus]MBZ9651624.1 hypothetical protein [Psychroflexus montanilacus]
MKKLFKKSLIIMLFISLLSFSQDRVNSIPDLDIGEFNLWIKGESFKGYNYDNKTKNWTERIGYLKLGEKETFIEINEKYDKIEEAKSMTSQNVIQLGLIPIKYLNESFVGLALEKFTGRYRYPAIKEDWIIKRSYYVYIFEFEEFEKIFNLRESTSILKSVFGTYGDPVQSDLKFQSTFENLLFLFEKSKFYEKDQIFKIEKTISNNSEVFRFLIPDKRSTVNSYNFEENYFEIPFENLNELKTIYENKIKD